jgi:hypothetical protein
MLSVYPVKRVVFVLKVIVSDEIFWSFIETSIFVNKLVTFDSSQVGSMQSILTIFRSWIILSVNWFIIFFMFAKNFNAGLCVASDLIFCACPDVLANVLRV